MAATCGPSPIAHRHRPSSPPTCCPPSSLVCSPPSLPFTTPAPTVPSPPVPLVCSPPPPPPVTVRCQPAPAIPLPPVTMSPLIAHLQPSVTDRHRWSEARRHRQSPLACSCRPITARHRWSVARCHCPSPSPPSCHYLPSRRQPHDTVRHCFHLDGDGELHTGGLTCCRPPAASSAAYL